MPARGVELEDAGDGTLMVATGHWDAEALQPVARELSALAALVHAESEAQDVHPMQLDPHTLVLSEEKRTQVMVKVCEISVYCTCWWYSLCTFQYRQHYEKTCSDHFDC